MAAPERQDAQLNTAEEVMATAGGNPLRAVHLLLEERRALRNSCDS